jgi:TRAP-type C4-dicarboxylate transport system permease small subunit
MIVSGIGLGIMTVTIFYQVVLRYVFCVPNIWAEELTRYLLAWVAFLAAPVAVRKNRHMQVDFIVNSLSIKAKAWLQLITYIIVFIYLIVLAKYGYNLVIGTVVNVSSGMQIPMAIPYASILSGTILMLLTCIEWLWKRAYVLVKFDELSVEEREALVK